MSNANLILDLKARKDQNGSTFYVGKLEFPGTLNFKDGVTFLIFIDEKGNEQMHITKMDKEKYDETF